MDVIKRSILNGVLKEKVYVEQLLGFKVGKMVYQLKKIIYGLKQTSNIWPGMTLNLYSCLNPHSKNGQLIERCS